MYLLNGVQLKKTWKYYLSNKGGTHYYSIISNYNHNLHNLFTGAIFMSAQ